TLARQSGLPGAETFVAWLSTAAVDAADRITVDGPFRRLDGFAVANNKADLIDGFASNSLHLDESGTYIGHPVYARTATSEHGVWVGGDCGGWTDGAQGTAGILGSPALARGPEWTNWLGTACSLAARLYCFQNQITQELPLFAD